MSQQVTARDVDERLDEELDRLGQEFAEFRSRLYEIEQRVDDLEEGDADVDDEELQDLREDVDELRAVIDTGADQKAYEQMTRQDKVRQIQATLIEEAEGMQTGKAAMEYKDVKWLFNGHPGTGHVYDLMEYAAREDGFNYQEREQNNRVTVDMNDVPESVKTSLEVSRGE